MRLTNVVKIGISQMVRHFLADLQWLLLKRDETLSNI